MIEFFIRFDYKTKMEELKKLLTCNICMEVSTLPVHPMCCESAKSMSPACMTCVRSYLSLNEPFHQRPERKKSWTGCGCDIYTKQKATNLYTHTYQLDSIRNAIGPSVCHHEECKAVCSTTAELRRHLKGTTNSGDKVENCQYAMTTCKHCDFYGVRYLVEGEHYKMYHDTFHCPICVKNISSNCASEHYRYHCKQMYQLMDIIESKNIEGVHRSLADITNDPNKTK